MFQCFDLRLTPPNTYQSFAANEKSQRNDQKRNLFKFKQNRREVLNIQFEIGKFSLACKSTLVSEHCSRHLAVLVLVYARIQKLASVTSFYYPCAAIFLRVVPKYLLHREDLKITEANLKWRMATRHNNFKLKVVTSSKLATICFKEIL